MIWRLAVVLFCTTLYTFVRYVIFADVSPIHMPVYLLNKSVSMASVFSLFCTALYRTKERVEETAFWGRSSFHSACIHILLSLAIISRAYYPNFFGTDNMNLTGEITILFGVLAAYCFWIVFSGMLVLMRRQVFQLFTTFFVAGHLVTMGFGGWLKVGEWYGGLPPISLVSFVFAIASLALFLRKGRGQFC